MNLWNIFSLQEDKSLNPPRVYSFNNDKNNKTALYTLGANNEGAGPHRVLRVARFSADPIAGSVRLR